MSLDRDTQLNGLEGLAAIGFQTEFRSHAKAILNVDYPDALREIEEVLSAFRISSKMLIESGGGETDSTQRLRSAFTKLGWPKKVFEVEKRIDGVLRESLSHEVDHVRTFGTGKVALEIEWNNKDPFFVRDLENFKQLHADGAISAGVIITRGKSLQEAMTSIIHAFAIKNGLKSFGAVTDFGLERTKRQQGLVSKQLDRGRPFEIAWSEAFVKDKFGPSTTHWRKLDELVKRGVGNPCPLVLIGIPASVVTP